MQQDQTKPMELYARAAELGSSKAHYHLGNRYRKGGNSKKAKFHYEAAAMLGCEVARCNLGNMEAKSGNMERAFKYWTTAASAGSHQAIHTLLVLFNTSLLSRDTIDSCFTAYNNSCAEMRSEARENFIRAIIIGDVQC